MQLEPFTRPHQEYITEEFGNSFVTEKMLPTNFTTFELPTILNQPLQVMVAGL